MLHRCITFIKIQIYSRLKICAIYLVYINCPSVRLIKQKQSLYYGYLLYYSLYFSMFFKKNKFSTKRWPNGKFWGYRHVFCLLLFSRPVVSDSLWPMDCRTLVLRVPHHFLWFAQVHFHCTGHATQPSHPLTPSSPAVSLSQHQGLFQWAVCSYQMTRILELQNNISYYLYSISIPVALGNYRV